MQWSSGSALAKAVNVGAMRQAVGERRAVWHRAGRDSDPQDHPGAGLPDPQMRVLSVGASCSRSRLASACSFKKSTVAGRREEL